jgi:mannosylglycerate hydrolase
MLTVHVVSHTHWDREWYHPAERFRQRLVQLVDELLDDLPRERAAFLLDGQTVVLDDYLEIRPERAADLAAALRSGRLEAGPWFVLADELIPGGEGLVRNLLAGQRALRALRAEAPSVLYCPDSFGHPAALPQLASGFGKTLIVLWRGFGGARWPRGNLFTWRSPSGEAARLYHLTRSGYELGAELPADSAGAAPRWRRIRAEFGERANVDVELLLNGADHHARQHRLAEALQELARVAAPDRVVASSLTAFAADVEKQSAGETLPEVAGELRDSYGYTWTLPGTLASRARQKRRYAVRERDLVRDVEPWVAAAAVAAGRSQRHLVRAAWRPLLLCQPHDTLCGCSIDAVARAMDARLESVEAQARGLREDALLALIGHDREAARTAPDAWRPVLLVRNPAPRARSGVALVQVDMKVADVPVGPGSAPPRDAETHFLQIRQFSDVLSTHDRTESPRSYPDNDAILRFHTAIWVNDVPPYGVVALPLGDDSLALPLAPAPVAVRGRVMSNGRLALAWNAKGRVSLTDSTSDRRVAELIGWESLRDDGDLYTPSLGRSFLKARLLDTAIIHRGPTMGVLEQRWRLQEKAHRVDVRLRLVIEAGSPFLRIGVLGDNAARDQRLRLVVRTDVSRGRTFADAAFGVVERLPVRATAADRKTETPVRTAPLHRYVSLFNAKRGATVFADGLTEYETDDERILVTLLRSVGELSRNDLPERPGHAGWPAATPEAQEIGSFEAELAVLLHGPRDHATIDEIERVADDVLHPLTGETLRSALTIPPPVVGPALEGRGLAMSTIKESEDGAWTVLRCTNLLDVPVHGAWRLNRPIREAAVARLDETPGDPLAPRDDMVAFVAAPRATVTILVR